MCGITGVISVNPEEITLTRLKKMTDIIGHRGPDGSGHWINATSNVGLGHRRLSVIDLSVEAGQPMHYLGRYSIIFNGEIYNYIELKQTLQQAGYVFKTASDTEVLMALYDKYKENCLPLLDGMFSFVIYDDESKELFIARDRFGEKPFFYSYEPGKYFVFGSEMKALWAAGIGKKVNDRMLYNYLTHGYLENPADLSETFYDNCKRLVHGHYMKFSLTNFKISTLRKYYDIDLRITNNKISEKEAEEKFRELFYTSVKRRLRSDVTVGSSLSGGIDSSLIVCVIDKLKQGTKQVQKTFSARFPGYKKDEGSFMDIVTARTETEPHYIFPTEKGLVKDIDSLCYHQEEPFASTSIYAQYCVMREAKENNVTVLLDGQGADEYLAGYHAYYTPFFNDLRLNHPERYQAEYDSYRLLQADNLVNNIVKKDIKYYIRARVPRLISPIKNSLAYYKQKTSSFLSTEFYESNRRNNFRHMNDFTGLNKSLHQSILHGGLQLLLRYADRNSMSHSREVRLPFLYHELVEFVFSLPPYMKIHEGWTKWLMRSAFSQVLPEPIAWRKDKIGYEAPQGDWFGNIQVKEKIHESKRKLFDHDVISKKEYQSTIISPEGVAGHSGPWALWMAGNLY